jgi:hypothetical protein
MKDKERQFMTRINQQAVDAAYQTEINLLFSVMVTNLATSSEHAVDRFTAGFKLTKQAYELATKIIEENS